MTGAGSAPPFGRVATGAREALRSQSSAMGADTPMTWARMSGCSFPHGAAALTLLAVMGCVGCAGPDPADHDAAGPDGNGDERVAALLGACFRTELRGVDVAAVRELDHSRFAGQHAITRADLECLARAGTSCTAARGCIPVTVRETESCGSEYLRCDGDGLVTCLAAVGGGPFEYREQCAALGATCVHAVPDLPSCVGGSYCHEETTRCVDDQHYELSRCGEVLTFECPALTACNGGRCRGGSCSPYPDLCDGDRAIACPPTGDEIASTFDCAAMEQHCVRGQCAPDRSECAPDSAWTCEADSIVRCTPGGAVERADCRALGFLGCAGGRCVASE